MWRGRISTREVATYASNLPRGAAVHQWFGGAMAVTEETEGAWLVEHAIMNQIWNAAGQSGKQPKMRDYPQGISVQVAKQKRATDNAARFQQKHS